MRGSPERGSDGREILRSGSAGPQKRVKACPSSLRRFRPPSTTSRADGLFVTHRCWIFAAIGLFLRFFDRESHVWRYLSDASYWIYVIHLPVVTTLQVALVRLDLSCWTKFFLCSTGAILISVVSYQLVVRSTIVGQILNGRRHPFHWLPGTV